MTRATFDMYERDARVRRICLLCADEIRCGHFKHPKWDANHHAAVLDRLDATVYTTSVNMAAIFADTTMCERDGYILAQIYDRVNKEIVDTQGITYDEAGYRLFVTRSVLLNTHRFSAGIVFLSTRDGGVAVPHTSNDQEW